MSKHRGWLIIEMLLLFGGLPVVLLFLQPRLIIPLLWTGAGVCLFVLLRDRAFDRRTLLNFDGLRKQLRPMLVRFALLGALLLAVVALVTPEYLFLFPKQRPELWAFVMVAYPVFSVVPQGVMYRAFFLHRYRPLLSDHTYRVAAAAVFFGWAHVIFLNPIGPGLTLAGGWLFASTHERSGSLAASCLEHALYGCLLMTSGWGWFVYAGGSGSLPPT